MPDGVWLGEGEELLAVDAGGGEGGGDVDPMVQKRWPRTSRAEGLLDDGHQPGRKKYYLTFSRNLGPPEKVEDELGPRLYRISHEIIKPGILLLYSLRVTHKAGVQLPRA